ncbi:RNA polymerase sigma factor [Pullulanibacillus sp. KACC 23026]|uniref:RNA polymerase sigma factor n=1 Tax=Pullulanibacillus sp. KACC 23026 TaxID=3028315 RepID=UPI0023AF3B1C|nr:RNA polymerase sigma factor [Pullulanibacillus sp. KACC 23026]WEG13586.1 RNA polymerase sigma factor [Pullulanibacillus sp. KACC 23026]
MTYYHSEDLLKEMEAGSVHAFNAFYESHRAYVYKLASQLTRNHAEAEDLCHDVFLEVFQKAGNFDQSRGSVQAWLTIKTKSRFIDRTRRAKRFFLTPNPSYYSDFHLDEGPDLNLMKNENIHELFEAIRHLPDAQQVALISKYFNEHTQKEIAHAMNKPLGTVKSLIRYGIINLRKLLNERGFLETEFGSN